ncbi:putative Tyrosinase [Glarea lozoyensis 74030]|uniref:Putative Tyrosinase n=1 Tax=Glarea lozoyensis (strain ATCC 74030 / MF5533) TaxID=1104152 RepID=H0ENP4_GLAL7|nr:putative Tyrosinase [Glarea lozoyensis 74030]
MQATPEDELLSYFQIADTSIGGGSGFFDAGHMSSVAYSAYDPIFWLHHTNVDRLTSMWQAINPSSFLVPSLDETGTFTHPINLDLTVSEPLIPFTTPSGSPYTSTSSRYLADFGYAYPELQDWLLSPEELRKNVTAWVNTHYNPAPKTRKLRRQSAVRKEWSVAISALGTAFGLTEKYIVELSINGTKFGDVFVAPPAAAEAEGHSLNATTNFEVDLTDVLAKHRVNGEDVNAVTGFLKTGLGCSARQGDGTITSGEKVPGLKALVSEMAVTPAGDVTEFPGYGERREYPEILAEMGA